MGKAWLQSTNNSARPCRSTAGRGALNAETLVRIQPRPPYNFDCYACPNHGERSPTAEAIASKAIPVSVRIRPLAPNRLSSPIGRGGGFRNRAFRVRISGEPPFVYGPTNLEADASAIGRLRQYQGVAQFGRVPHLECGCCRFESCRPDHLC
jgi:hypothetical protein